MRARDLTQQLLTFARGGTPVKSAASMAEIITDSAEFALRGSNVECEYRLARNLWTVEVDKGQISQVITNLVINADQAMPEGGKIRIKAENMTLEGDISIPDSGRQSFVKVSIKDEGIGIPEEYLVRIFDPYFTTKESGSGLGLATTYSIIKRHGGLITVESKPGSGTTFYIYLPAIPVSPSPTEKVIPDGVSSGGRVLIMDDEESVREVVGRILEHVGWEVEFACDGAEAIERYVAARDSGRSFDAVIMDLTVPGGMGGKEAITRLKSIDPQVKAIVSSGYSNDPVMSDYAGYGFNGVISKPYRIEELIKVLQELMNNEK